MVYLTGKNRAAVNRGEADRAIGNSRPVSARLNRRELWLSVPFFTSGSCCHWTGSRNGCFGVGRPESDVSSRIHMGLKTSANVNNATCGPFRPQLRPSQMQAQRGLERS